MFFTDWEARNLKSGCQHMWVLARVTRVSSHDWWGKEHVFLHLFLKKYSSHHKGFTLRIQVPPIDSNSNEGLNFEETNMQFKIPLFFERFTLNTFLKIQILGILYIGLGNQSLTLSNWFKSYGRAKTI